MARITPDGYLRFYWLPAVADISGPTAAEMTAGTDLTSFITPAGIDTPEEGTDADSSSLASARDFSIPATIGGDIVGEFYRDDVPANDTAWSTLPRLTEGFLVIGRFGGSGVGGDLATGDEVEVYPVRVSQRSNSRLVRGEAERFVARFALSTDPDLAATLAA